MSSSSFSIPKFDVFLSFSGEDSDKTFISDLYQSLSEKGITTYYKDDKLEERVLPLGSDLSKCIEESKLAVVVITESYPTSVWCLDQLQRILKSQEEGRLSILPIFYEADPSNVRKQTGEFAEPFSKLDDEYPSEKVQAWRTALTKLTNISGLDSRLWNDEGNMIGLITNEISLIVSAKPINPLATKTSGLFGLDRHLQALNGLLNSKSDEEVRLIAIWGPEGVGKTTVATYAYEEMSCDFNVKLFVANAQEIYNKVTDTASSSSEKSSSKEVQNEAQTVTRSTPNVSTDVIKSKVGYRKGLLVIDCVDNIKQLKDIADIIGWCGSGSRVILITQDKKLLDEFGVKHVYEVKSLRYDEALQLFSYSAFKQEHPPTSFEPLSLRAVQIACFLPLTLKILGSSLQGKDEEEWENELQELEGDRAKAIMEVMKTNYTRANEKEKIPSFILPLNSLSDESSEIQFT